MQQKNRPVNMCQPKKKISCEHASQRKGSAVSKPAKEKDQL
jgi:hypothetical protein